ncbi:LOW QUALITY PROTEIN: hypothetical protein V2J09_008298 [Rumex salicifolius]
MLDNKDNARTGDKIFEDLAVSIDESHSCHKQSSVASDSDDLREKQSENTQDESNILVSTKPLVYCFPGLEKYLYITGLLVLLVEFSFCICAVVIVAPEKSSRLGEERDVYLWIVLSPLIRINTQKGIEVGNVGLVDLNQIGSNVLLYMGVPGSTNFKIAREGEEPLDFLELHIWPTWKKFMYLRGKLVRAVGANFAGCTTFCTHVKYFL